jgi:hypothetical protein
MSSSRDFSQYPNAACKALLWIFLLLPLSYAAAEEDPVAVYLTWQRDPTTTMTVQWITEVQEEKDAIFYQKEGDSAWEIAVGAHAPMPESEPYLIHKVELVNLTPGDSYFFKTGEKSVVTRKFRTMPLTLNKPIRFVVGGDMYPRGIEYLIETNREAAKADPHFAMVGGDLAYAAGKSPGKSSSDKRRRWLRWLMAWSQHMVTPEGYLIPMIPAVGNHDVNGGYGQTPAQAPFFYSLFAFPGPQGYNVLDFGSYLSLVVLDSAHTNPIYGEQTLWLHRVLENKRDIPNKFALYHVPAYPCVRRFKELHSTQIRKHWVPVFENSGLTAAFEHHDHAYKRTWPIYRGQINPKGVLYLGDGAWGVKTPRKPRDAGSLWYLAKTARARHFILVTLDGGNRHYTAIDSKGKVIDTYSQTSAPPFGVSSEDAYPGFKNWLSMLGYNMKSEKHSGAREKITGIFHTGRGF